MYKRQGCRGTRDTWTISASGKEKLTKSTSWRTHNTSIDSSIDLKSYIASAKKTNQELIAVSYTHLLWMIYRKSGRRLNSIRLSRNRSFVAPVSYTHLQGWKAKGDSYGNKWKKYDHWITWKTDHYFCHTTDVWKYLSAEMCIRDSLRTISWWLYFASNETKKG